MGVGSFISSLCEYESVRIVRIKDKRLAVVYYVLIFFVLLYVIGFTFILKHRYLLIYPAEGIARVNWHEPKNPAAIVDTHYCKQNRSDIVHGDLKWENHNCVHWDAGKAVFPLTEQSATMLTTRVAISYGELNCSQLANKNDEHSGVACDYTDKSPPVEQHALPADSYYVADPELFTVMIDHSMFATGAKYTGKNNGRDLDGFIMGKKGGKEVPCWGTKEQHEHFWLNSYPCTKWVVPVKPNSAAAAEDGAVVADLDQGNQGDIIRLDLILKAAGIGSLEEASKQKKEDKRDGIARSLRYDGLVLYMQIYYSNLKTFDLYDVEYYYKVHEVEGADFRALDLKYWQYPHYRAMLQRHGVRIVFEVHGDIGFFDFQTCLINVVTGLALLAVGTTVVDVLATKLLPQRKEYEKWKYVSSDVIEGDVSDFLGLGDDDEQASAERKSPLLPKNQNADVPL